MAYCTIADIQDRISEQDLIRLTDDENTGAMDTGKIDDAIAEAAAEIDSYCAKRHTVPFSDPAPAMISKICKDIAVYNLWSLQNAVPENAADRHKKAVSYLKDIAAGTVQLGGDAPAEVDYDGPEASTSSENRIFTMDNMGSF